MIRLPPRSTLFPLHDALPISRGIQPTSKSGVAPTGGLFEASPDSVGTLRRRWRSSGEADPADYEGAEPRSEEHTSELQSRQYLVCRLLLEKKKQHRKSCYVYD